MTALDTRNRARWRLSRRVLANWPRLMASFAIGVVVTLGAFLFAPGIKPGACWITGWDAFCVAFMLLVPAKLARAGPEQIRARAAQQDEGQALILALVLTGCIASIAAVGMELSMARGARGPERALDVMIALATVTASWLVIQTMFALHYAHEYYAADPATGRDLGGLAFPGDEAPDYWDFLHFSMIIGVAAQTADVAFTQKRLRRLGTVHSLIAFAFNTLIVALTINLVASLF